MRRRDFVRTASLSIPAMGLFPAGLQGMKRAPEPSKLEKRSLGKTGAMLSVIGFGGIVVMDATPAAAAAAVRKAIDAGVNYFDVAPSYGDAEVKLGPALEPYRKDVFLACKTGRRTRDEARKELEKSLVNMRTDHFDLYQHHAVTTLEEVDQILGPGGAMETFLEARKEGKIKFIGFSAHSVEAALALMTRFDFDTILFPFNYATWYAGNFGPQVLEMAHGKNMGILALKSMARGPWGEGADKSGYPKCWYEPLTSEQDIEKGLRFTLSHPITAAVPPGEEKLFMMALGMADRLKPLDDGEVLEMKEKAFKGEPLFRYES
ncbi:MAG: aldo/keto reductase [Bacteroidales bacterium]|jgi:aryl-alcohol dehydrogenase-like predicted oxidoreductase|nr:aldo/keto reductase [Bacteroidales bacterium]